MAPPAPLTFSITTDCLSRSPRRAATRRALTSTLPPAVYGTIRVIGLASGHALASAATGNAAQSAAARSTRRGVLAGVLPWWPGGRARRRGAGGGGSWRGSSLSAGERCSGQACAQRVERVAPLRAPGAALCVV